VASHRQFGRSHTLPRVEREVRYCTTTDGVSIAYWTLGDGPPLMYIPEPVLTASAADDKLPATKRWYDALSSNRRVIRFDHRGTGLSRHNDDYSLDALERTSRLSSTRLVSQASICGATWTVGSWRRLTPRTIRSRSDA
jgi:pimeloyl-ACP methyl ester carboxylesterase